MISKLTARQRVIAGAGLAAFVTAFLPWCGVDFGFRTLGVDGWSTGTKGAAGVLLCAAAGVYLVLRRLEFEVWAPAFGDTWLAVGLAVAGTGLVSYQAATLPRFAGVKADPRFGIWLALAAAVIQTVAVAAEARGAAPG